MYKIFSDGYTVYNPIIKDCTIINGRVELEVNKAGSLTFQIPESNPHYGMIKLMKSIIELYEDDRLIFRGRPYSPSRNLYRDNKIFCEGELAFFNDTYQNPFEFYGTVEDLFTQAVESHNAQVSEEKQFKVGVVNVTNNTEEGHITRSSMEYLKTWNFLEDKFLKPLGGYLHIRHEADGVYIDYLNDLNYLSSQEVKQGINLIDASEETTPSELATIIVPLGSKIKDDDGNDTDVYTTIENVNDGKIFIESTAGIEEYGRIVKIVHHDDITEPSNLKSAGENDLAAALGVTTSIELSAADLSKCGYKVDPFKFGTYVPVKIESLNIDKNMLIRKMSIDLLNPLANKISVGDSVVTFRAQSLNTSKTIDLIKSDIAGEKRLVQQTISQIKKEMASRIEQTEEYILTEVSEKYLSESDTRELISSLSTEIEQNAAGIEIRFEQLKSQLSDVGETVNAQNQYIRLVEGEIHIGKSDSPVTTIYTNDALEFRYNGQMVARFTNDLLEVRNISVDNQVAYFDQWAIRKGAYVDGVGYNLNDVWIGG